MSFLPRATAALRRTFYTSASRQAIHPIPHPRSYRARSVLLWGTAAVVLSSAATGFTFLPTIHLDSDTPVEDNVQDEGETISMYD